MRKLAIDIDVAALERELTLPANQYMRQEHAYAAIGRQCEKRSCRPSAREVMFRAVARALRKPLKFPADRGATLAPIIVENGDVIVLKNAVRLVNRNERTIRRWCRRYAIARQAGPAAPLEISAPALLMVAQGDMEALDLLRSSDREHPRVARYFDHIGISTHRPRPS